MDSLKSLMDRQEYELVLKLTADSQDINHLFYRISAFLALGRGEEALDTIKNNRQILEHDPYLLAKIHIEILCLLQSFDEAYQEIEHYKNLPYVSQQMEELLKDLPGLVRQEEKNSLANHEVNNETLKKRLMSDDENSVLPSLDMIRGRDINIFLKEVQHIMVNFPKQAIRSFALLLLVQKKLDREFKFNHVDKIIIVNPSKLEPPFVGDEFNDFVRALQSEIKDPAVNNDAVQILSSYILYMYPEQLHLNYAVLIEALRNISEDYLQVSDRVPLEQRFLEKGIDVEETEQLIQRIKEAVNNF